MAKDPDAKKDAAEKKAGKPDSDTPKIKAEEKKLGVGAAGPGKVFGSNRMRSDPISMSRMPSVPKMGKGQDAPKKVGTGQGFQVKKGGLGGRMGGKGAE